ncbi:MAG: argininosuccinate lyase [Polyangiaceae bacterium]
MVIENAGGSIARTAATGAGGMIPALLAWSSSMDDDWALVREDILGSSAHVTMLGRKGLVDKADAATLRAELLSMFELAERRELSLPTGEEDVHMAIEAHLTTKLGEVGKRLHTARSRNDQVSTALRLHVRTTRAHVVAKVAELSLSLLTRARAEAQLVLPAYTHRQRAQPISGAFLIGAWTAGLLRAGKRLADVDVSECPLGSGACSGSSLPIDRALTASLLGFSGGPTKNALDTVGDRDFSLDYVFACTRVLLALSRLATDVIDYATSEFGFVKLGDTISAGSSMMPQKKNPDIFELVRSKASFGAGNVVQMMTLVRGLHAGYSRDLQDDRRATLGTGPVTLGAIEAVSLAFPHVVFDADACLRAVSDGSTQATDLAEALVRTGLPFRDAYRAAGALVKYALGKGVPLAHVSEADAKTVHSAFDSSVLAVLDPRRAVLAKESFGGTGPSAVSAQLEALEADARALLARSEGDTLALIASRISATAI